MAFIAHYSPDETRTTSLSLLNICICRRLDDTNSHNSSASLAINCMYMKTLFRHEWNNHNPRTHSHDFCTFYHCQSNISPINRTEAKNEYSSLGFAGRCIILSLWWVEVRYCLSVCTFIDESALCHPLWNILCEQVIILEYDDKMGPDNNDNNTCRKKVVKLSVLMQMNSLYRPI